MRVLSVGAGAIGGIVAARLVWAGEAPVVIDADPGHVARLRDPGLRVDGSDGGTVTPLDAHVPDDAPADGIDVLLLAVRTAQTRAALGPFAGRVGDVVSLQNGLNEDAIAELVGPERTVGCVVGFAATYLGPGRVELTESGDLAIGRLDGSVDDRLEAVSELLGKAFPTRITTNIRGALWGKIIVNCTTVLGALTGSLLGELLDDPSRRRLVAHAVAEAVDVARAEGVELPKVLGGVDPDLVADRRPGWLEALDEALAFVGEHFGRVKSVTLRDFELGRKPEIDAVTGEIVRRGRRRRVDVPVNARAYEMLREISAGEREIDPANLRRLRSALG